MLDAKLRPFIDLILKPIAKSMISSGISANQITIVGAFFGFLAVILIAIDQTFFALLLIILNRIADGLDGTVAQLVGPTDFGGYLDLVADFVFYSAIPFAFAIADPNAAIAACFLCVSFMGTACSFLGVAILAAKQNVKNKIHGNKSFYYLGGLTEGTETILVFCAMAIWPVYFIYFAWGFGLLCWVTTATRIYSAYIMFSKIR